MFQTDSRDLTADREAEEHEHYVQTYGEASVSSADPLFLENEKLEKCRLMCHWQHPKRSGDPRVSRGAQPDRYGAHSQSGHMCSDSNAVPEAVSSQSGGCDARRDNLLDTGQDV